VLLVVITVAGDIAHARHRTGSPHKTLSTLAGQEAGLVLSGVLRAGAVIPIQAQVWSLTVPLNSYVTKGQVIGEALSPVLPDQDEEGSGVARAWEDVPRAEEDLEAARASEAEAGQGQFAPGASERWQETVAVVSPADGILVTLDQGAGTLGISSDSPGLRVETQTPADDLSKLRVGQPAWVWADAGPQVTLRATVSEIAETPIDSPSGPVYPVTLSVDDPHGPLLAGEKVQVRTAR